MGMTITTSGPQETAEKRYLTRAAAQTEPKLIEDGITVMDGPPDASSTGDNASEANGFRASQKTARTPPQATAQPVTQTKDKHDPPHAPRAPTRVKKFQPIDFTELEEDAEDAVKPKQPTTHEPSTHEPATCETATCDLVTRQPIEMLNTIKEMVASLMVMHSSEAAKSKILESIIEVADMLKEQCEPASIGRIEEIKATAGVNNSTKSRSWAQVVANPGQRTAPDIHLEMAKRERLEKLKKERAKTEVTISTRTASDDAQRDIDALNEKDLTKLLEQHIHGCLKAQGKQDVIIKRAWKAAKHIVKIQCNSIEDTALIKELNWEKLLAGASITVPMYGLVVHGAPKYDIDVRNGDIKEVKEYIENANQIKVKYVRPLMCKPRNPEAPTESIVIFTEHLEEANACINEGLRMGRRILHAERYAPQYQIKQCFRCQGYGHRAENCKKEAQCGKCAKNHETHECSQNNKAASCIQCQGSHVAWHHGCPRRQKEIERLEILRTTLPPYFLC
jgi:hypothetical protein